MAEEQKPVAVPAEETPATTTTETTAAATDAAAPTEAAKEETAPAGMRNNSPVLSNMTNVDTTC